MSLPKPDIHVRLSETAMRELRFLAEAEGTEISRVATRLLEASLLGATHAMKVAAKRVLLSGIHVDDLGR